MRRLRIVFFLVVSMVLLTGCSYHAHFILANKSGKTIKVAYQLRNTDKLVVFPTLGIATVKQFDENNNYDRLSENRYTLDSHSLTYSVELNDQEVLFLTVVDIRSINDEPMFKSGLSNLSIESDTGSVNYAGDRIFPQFVPGRTMLWPGSPLLYTITHK